MPSKQSERLKSNHLHDINVDPLRRRFEEECTTLEEEDCKTVYDQVWEKKCEMVNVTVPQTDCQESTETQMETK